MYFFQSVKVDLNGGKQREKLNCTPTLLFSQTQLPSFIPDSSVSWGLWSVSSSLSHSIHTYRIYLFWCGYPFHNGLLHGLQGSLCSSTCFHFFFDLAACRAVSHTITSPAFCPFCPRVSLGYPQPGCWTQLCTAMGQPRPHLTQKPVLPLRLNTKLETETEESNAHSWEQSAQKGSTCWYLPFLST